MQPTTRRDFLRNTALTVSGSLLAARTAWAIPAIGRTRPSHLKLSLAAYSYRQLLQGNEPKMDLFDFVNLAADQGLDGVELTSYYFPADVTTEYLHRIKQHAFVLGLDISGTSVGNNFCVPDGPARDKQMELVRTWVDRAAELDAPVIRIFAGTVAKGDDEAKAVERAIDGIKASLPYAAERGVSLALENHGGITATPGQLLKLVKAVDAPNFGVNLDTGNFHGEDPYADLAELAPYAVNVQVKTEISRKGQKKEEADLAKVIDILRTARYSGYVVLEYEAAEDPMKAVPRHIKTLRNLIDAR
ncbi:sugar phosphate isomerase/epimerase family protein [Singulisphaera acidiphila]|uniref:Sugar phosphate isomerase/epimerase n=1 Tax=Singulisphaera acidiphila (strain ATCC BAA-1392 / DSM 18658 / VKM B-2454 / MOB10) TaxID=886293 RepID=L0DMP1_SINAD|nr:sugar phosphate isomerase/epimerase family protein [Singulisphaera acidiphila]AGA30095.1 sugar phosphate isomerase/epimerase [Singulisphaera acidiphila DSM 18658]